MTHLLTILGFLFVAQAQPEIRPFALPAKPGQQIYPDHCPIRFEVDLGVFPKHSESWSFKGPDIVTCHGVRLDELKLRMTRGGKFAGQYSLTIRAKVHVPPGNDRMILIKATVADKEASQTFEADEDESSWDKPLDLPVRGKAGGKILPLMLEIKASPSVYPGF